MVKIAVCDDSEYDRKEILRHLIDYSIDRGFEYSADEYETGESLLASGRYYDLVFLDYDFETKGRNGIEVARILRRERRDDTIIIFLSAYPEAVFDSFEVGTFRFLVKPIDNDKFRRALDQFLSVVEGTSFLKIRIEGSTQFINEKKILYIEGCGKGCIIHFMDKNDDITIGEILGNIEKRVNDIMFFRCHRSYLINLYHVRSYKYILVTLDNGKEINVGRKKYGEFVKRYTDFIAEGEQI